MAKEEKVDQKPDIAITLETLVGIGALFICID